MTPLTLAYAIENKFTAVDCVKYFKPDWSDDLCNDYLYNATWQGVNSKNLLIEQLNKQLTEPEQHTVVGC